MLLAEAHETVSIRQAVANTETDIRKIGDASAPDDPNISPVGWSWTEPEFETVFLQNYARVVALLIRLVGDRARAEELADDAFWKLYLQSLAPDRRHNLAAWLYRTASRMGIDALREAARRARHESSAATDARTPAGSTPLADVLRAETQAQVRLALSRLRRADAQMLALRSQGFSYKEIAEALGVKPGSVGTLLARAEAAFENVFLELFGDRSEKEP